MAEETTPDVIPEKIVSSITTTHHIKLETLKVLLVDDSRSFLYMLEGQLKRKGFTKIVTASNGREAIEKIRSEQFDLILCDWDMPVMNGFELAKEIKTDPGLVNIPFIMITAKSSKADILNAIRKGVDNYIVKPIQVDVLVKKITETMQKKQLKGLDLTP